MRQRTVEEIVRAIRELPPDCARDVDRRIGMTLSTTLAGFYGRLATLPEQDRSAVLYVFTEEFGRLLGGFNDEVIDRIADRSEA